MFLYKLIFPSSLRYWNDLDITTRNSFSLSEFKHRNKQISEKPLNYKVARDRASEIAFTRIKHTCSSLKADLFKINIVPSALCSCGPINETAEHYFFHCPLYDLHRNRLSASIPVVPVTLNTLLHGHEYLTNETKEAIYNSVLQFIKDTGRFF